MSRGSSIFEISLMARVTWDIHSLNNEGTVGNVTEPRTVVLADGRKSDGVSGEMLKHIHSYNVWLVEADKSSFCPPCACLQPQKADEPRYRRTLTGGSNTEIMSQAIKNCVLCDLHGFMIQEPPISRRSTIEFGWAVGIPERFHRDIHLHARHSQEERQPREQRAAAGQQDQQEVSAQMLYHRPTRSGVYALVSLFQPWRIGLNEINYEYALQVDEQERRYSLALEAYKAFFTRADGAMTSTRLPHVEAIEGIVAISEGNFPVPVLSPLRDSYKMEVTKLCEGKGYAKEFDSLSALMGILDELKKKEILNLKK